MAGSPPEFIIPEIQNRRARSVVHARNALRTGLRSTHPFIAGVIGINMHDIHCVAGERDGFCETAEVGKVDRIVARPIGRKTRERETAEKEKRDHMAPFKNSSTTVDVGLDPAPYPRAVIAPTALA